MTNSARPLDLRTAPTARNGWQDSFLISGSAILGVSALGAAFGSREVLSLVPFVGLTSIVPVLGNLATFAVLLATWHFSVARRSVLVLMLTYAACALFSILQVCTMPLTPYAQALIAAGAQAAIWFGLFSNIFFVAGAIVYAHLRNVKGNCRAASSRFVRRATSIAIVLTLITIGTVTMSWLPLPQLVNGTSIEGLRSTGVGPAMLFLIAIARIMTLGTNKPEPLDRALGLSLLALAMGTVLSIVDPHRFTAGWYASRLLTISAPWFACVTAVQMLVASRTSLDQTKAILTDVESRSALNSDRLLATWKIASDSTHIGSDRNMAILEAATRSLRPSLPMIGFLTRLDGERVVIESVSWTGTSEEARVFRDTVYPGSSFPLEVTTQGLVHVAGCTQVWDDLDAIKNQSMAFRQFGWQCMIATPFQIGRTSYFLTFASPHGTRGKCFGIEDVAYVEVVASFFVSRFTEEQQFERIKFQMEHDALTGVANRVQFRKAAQAEIAARKPFAIALLDLDGFHFINDAYGNMIGDELLVEVAAMLRGVDEGNLVARLAGDEFAVLLRGSTSVEHAKRCLEAYAAVFRAPFNTGDRDGTRRLGAAASIGAALFPAHGNSVEEVLHSSSVALASVKEAGGAATSVFGPALETRLAMSRTSTSELAEAIAADQLALVYQPTFELSTRAIVGAEALVRWDHPTRGRLAPSEFIPLAERTGLVAPLSRWVLARVLRDLASWKTMPDTFRCYMNLAPQQLGDPDVIEDFTAQFEFNRSLIDHLGVEITESAVMHHVERATATLNMFRNWGIRVAIDDFGTGYSSLSYIKQLPVDVIKIDRSFVTGLPGDKKDAAVCDMILRIAENFNLLTLAEGIETEAQAEWLFEHGCRRGQGYFIAKPLEFDAMCELATASSGTNTEILSRLRRKAGSHGTMGAQKRRRAHSIAV
jgi:diguanylate cyclase (GGDEF)-like protein